MKRSIVVVMIAALFMLIPVICFSEEPVEQKDTATLETTTPERGMMGQGMMAKGMMGQPMMQQGQARPMQGMMMKAMMEKEMVATPDGGVIIMVGNKLLKYDKDLNLKKEVEIVKFDKEAMMEKMGGCKCASGGCKCAGSDCKCKEMMQQNPIIAPVPPVKE